MTKQDARLKAFWPALVLILIAIVVNYVDRGNLSLAAPLLKAEWHLTASQMGVLLASFFWSYAFLQVPAGWLADRQGAARVLAIGFLIWSLATAASAWVTGLSMMLFMRLSLGVGESAMFPAASKIFAQHLDEGSRGIANGLMAASMRWGIALGTLGGGLLIAHFGWRNAFMVIGLASLLWLPAWQLWQPRGMHLFAKDQGPLPGFGAILRQRAFWGTSIGHFCNNYISYVLLTWLPSYIVEEQHQTMAVMASAVAAVWAVDSLSSVATGWLTDRAIASGTTPTFARKAAMAVGFSTMGVALCVTAFATPKTYFACLLAVAVGCGVANAGIFAIGQTLSGPRVAGRWTGMQNCIANLSGVVAPAITGVLVDRTGHYGVAFALSAGVTVLGGLAWVVGVKRVEAVEWELSGAEPLPESVAR